INATQSQFNNQNAVQGNSLIGQAIASGNAFGGDRAGVAAGNLANQQQMAQAPVIAGLENQGYAQALGEFNNQQGVNLGAQQANKARLLQAGSQMGQVGSGMAGVGSGLSGIGSGLSGIGSGLTGIGSAYGSLANTSTGVGSAAGTLGTELGNIGTSVAGLGASRQTGQINAGNAALAAQNSVLGAQQAGLGASQASLAAGTQAQQTKQAQDAAAYQQYQLGQAFPYAQQSWLAGINTGAASAMGGNSSTTGPAPSALNSIIGGGATLGAAALMSDERVKEDIRKVGKTFDGKNLYSFKYKGS